MFSCTIRSSELRDYGLNSRNGYTINSDLEIRSDSNKVIEVINAVLAFRNAQSAHVEAERAACNSYTGDILAEDFKNSPQYKICETAFNRISEAENCLKAIKQKYQITSILTLRS